MGTFVVDDESASAIVDAFESHGVEVPVDIDHQTMPGHAAPDGSARAVGWIVQVFAEPGRGLFGMVRWNDRGKILIRADEYKYLSPVLMVRASDRRAMRLHSVGLVNVPAISGMEAVAASQHPNTEGITMPSDNPVELERLVGELRALLKEKGVEIAEDGGRNGIIQAAIDTLKGKKDDDGKATDSKATGDAKAIASSVRTRLGLEPGASQNEVALALSLAIDSAGKGDASASELSAMKAADKARHAETLCAKYVASNRLNKNDTEQYAAAMALAREDPDRFEKVMGATKPLVQPGRTTAPAAASTQRGTMIANAAREFDDNPELAKLCNRVDHVQTALRGGNMAKMSDVEAKSL